MAASLRTLQSRRQVLAASVSLAGGLLLPWSGGGRVAADTIEPLPRLPRDTRIPSPNFDNRPQNIESFVTGVRPEHPKGIQLKLETRETARGHKWIVHNYGHGGAGLTLSWGSAVTTVDNIFEAIKQVKQAGLTPRIVILGAGIAGLTTARELVARWPRREMPLEFRIHAKAFLDTTSYIAGGQFEPSGIFRDYERVVPGGVSTLRGLLATSHRVLLDLGQGLRTRYGIERRFNFSLGREVEGFSRRYMPPGIVGGPHDWDGLPFERLNHRSGKEYETWLINPRILMPAMRSDLTREGVVFRIGDQRVLSPANLFDFDENIIVNCTGIGARILFGDNELIGRRGHLVRLNNPRQRKYLFSLSCTPTGGTDTVSSYVFCRSDAIVVGGTWIRDENYADPRYGWPKFEPADSYNPLRSNRRIWESIINRARHIMSGLDGCPSTGPR